MRLRALTVAGACALAAGVTACGGAGEGGGGGQQAAGNNLTIYSSLPLQGGQRANSEAMNNGIKLALQQAGGKVGNFKVSLKMLDDSTAQAGKWEAGKTQQNARTAVQDKTTIGYIGEFNSGASANSIPILNKAGILQVSPGNTAVGLTTEEAGAEPGEPGKYYPTGQRTYARVVPRDTVQGAALAQIMKKDGCTKVFIANDTEVYGQGLATNASNSLKEVGVQVVGNEGYDAKAANYRSLAAKIKGTGADCFFGSIIVDNNGVQLFKDVLTANPGMKKLYGPDGVATATFTDPKEGGLPANVAAKTVVTVATLDPSRYPAEGRQFFAQYRANYKKKAEPYAIYGYEAMNVLLDAVKRAGPQGNDRKAVLEALFATKGRQSVLGTYDIDKNGDTTLTDYGVYNIRNGDIDFREVVKPAQ